MVAPRMDHRVQNQKKWFKCWSNLQGRKSVIVMTFLDIQQPELNLFHFGFFFVACFCVADLPVCYSSFVYVALAIKFTIIHVK